MGTIKLKVKDLRNIDFPSDSAKSIALKILHKHLRFEPKEVQLAALQLILNDPEAYLEHDYWIPLAKNIIGKSVLKTSYEVHMLKKDGQYNIYGRRHIDESAIRQMETAMRLPVALAGALMPDAHYGYGLPIGGVLATDNAVIPYGVGLDIGCRMALTICEQPASYVDRKVHEIRRALHKVTHFGTEGALPFDAEHEIIEDPRFFETDILKKMRHKAWYQLGTSGTGNHFVELGRVTLSEDNTLGLPAGQYSGILTHSGSRGMGAAIAGYYTKRAIELRNLPNEVKALSWLSLEEELGQEYWLAMNLAGDYAKANHDVIHANLLRVMGLTPLLKVENHHNFAWKENHNGREMIVHRKGATPAGQAVAGIIPGNMAGNCYIVTGKGHPGSLSSASHGAGRAMSRREAFASVAKSDMLAQLEKHGITLIGGSREEAPQAYKNIEEVIGSQQELIRVEGTFFPKVVRMHGS